MNEILLFILQGYSILLVAIILNLIANAFRIKTWFWFMEGLSRLGIINTIRALTVYDLVFMFILYPIALIASIQIPGLIFK